MRYSNEFLDELRSRMPLSALISRRVKLERRGREYLGLCPFHAEKTPSFYVIDDQRFFHCFGCGAHGDAIGFLMRADNLDFRAAVARLAGGLEAAVTAAPSDKGAPAAPIARREKDERNRRIACQLWRDAHDPRGTLVETYLRGRGVSLPPAPVLRFAPQCWNRETGKELPAMLARIDDANGNFLAVHRTWLRPDGKDKADLEEPKWSLASTRGGAIRLAPAAPVLAIAEGIENALTAIVANYAAWSAVSKGGFKTVMLPADVREVLIVADCDKNGEGQRAAERASERWLAEGRRVRLWLAAHEGQDLNDVVRSGGGSERAQEQG